MEIATAGRERRIYEALHWVFQFVFGCHHGELSRVFTIKKRTYQVCFECGREIDYSWERMGSLAPSFCQSACTTESQKAWQAPII